MEVEVTTGAVRCAKLQSNHHHQQTNTLFLQAGCPSCHPTNSVKALKGKHHIPWKWLPQAHLGIFQLYLWPLIAPGYLEEGCHASHQPSDASTPSRLHAERQNYYTDYSNIDAVGWMTPALADYEVLLWATFGRSGLTRSELRPKQKPKLTVLVVVV